MSIQALLDRSRSARFDNPFASDHDFAELQRQARQRLADTVDSAFVEAPSTAELYDNRRVAEEVRALRRDADLIETKDALKHAERRRRQEIALVEAHADALAEQQRLTNPAARVGELFRGSKDDSRILNGVMWGGVIWGAFNVQHNMMSGVSMAEPRYWLAFLIEPMITLPLIAMMRLATRAAREGHTLAKKKIWAVEFILLMLALLLNVGPQVGSGNLWSLVEYAVAPIMIAAVVVMHAFASSEYATMIGKHVAVSPASEPLAPVALDVVPSAA
ncbi:hypothetical protein [Nocardia sp. NPDC050435]|uniref:hypothetical protein n=1 Tax=Nocardia sp. NPDC050435 TaxID=3155040 RepID=UPI0033FD30D8